MFFFDEVWFRLSDDTFWLTLSITYGREQSYLPFNVYSICKTRIIFEYERISNTKTMRRKRHCAVLWPRPFLESSNSW